MRSAMMRQTVPTPGASARAAALGVAAKTSATRMAPPGPEPRSAWMSTPRSVASRRAFGDAAASRAAVPSPAAASLWRATWAKTSAFSILPPAGLTCVRSTPCSWAILRARGEALTAGAGTTLTPAGGCPGATDAASSEAKISAIVCPTGTTSPARAVTSPRTPETGASISVVALSVSLSTSGSPFRTLSPGDLSQCRTLPVSCASSSAGMMTFVGISASRFPAEGLRRLQDHLFRGHRQVLEYRRERHRDIHGPDALDRRVEVIECPLGDHRRELGGHAVPLVALVNHDGARGLLHRIDPRLLVEGCGRARVD